MPLMIGELSIETMPNANSKRAAIAFSAEGITLPAGPDSSDFVRSREELAQFAGAVGLYEELFDHNGAIGGDSGVRLVTRALVFAVNNRFHAIKNEGSLLSEKHAKAFKWLHFWINWAYENCETPVIVYLK